MTATATIPEAASGKPQRGRPRSLTKEEESFIDSLGPAGCYRSKVHLRLAGHAGAVLRRHCGITEKFAPLPAPFDWLERKMSLMAELGRIGDETSLVECARVVCEHRGPVKVTIARIRRLRLGTINNAPGDEQAASLRREIESVITRHVHANDLDEHDVRTVLEELLGRLV